MPILKQICNKIFNQLCKINLMLVNVLHKLRRINNLSKNTNKMMKANHKIINTSLHLLIIKIKLINRKMKNLIIFMANSHNINHSSNNIINNNNSLAKIYKILTLNLCTRNYLIQIFLLKNLTQKIKRKKKKDSYYKKNYQPLEKVKERIVIKNNHRSDFHMNKNLTECNLTKHPPTLKKNLIFLLKIIIKIKFLKYHLPKKRKIIEKQISNHIALLIIEKLKKMT